MVMNHLEDLLVKYGKPLSIKADNGPEFLLDCRDRLAEFAVSHFNSPTYDGQFNACHERIHRTIKDAISNFSVHLNLTKLALELDQFRDEYCYYNGRIFGDGHRPSPKMAFKADLLSGGTSAEIDVSDTEAGVFAWVRPYHFLLH